MIFYIIFGIYILTNRKTFQFIVAIWMLFVGLNFYKIIDVSQNPFASTLGNAKNIEFIYRCIIGELTLKNKLVGNQSTALAIFLAGIILLATSWINEMEAFNYFPKMDILNFGIPFSLIIYRLISLETSKAEGKIKSLLLYLGDASNSIFNPLYFHCYFRRTS